METFPKKISRWNHFFSIIIVIALCIQSLPVSARIYSKIPDEILLPGEKIITLSRDIQVDGIKYQIHYITKDIYNENTSKFIGELTPSLFQEKDISAIVISSDNGIVVDVELYRKILLLYRAAYYLYEYPLDPDFFAPESLAQEMTRLVNNPLLKEWWVNLIRNRTKLFSTTQSEYEEAMRGIITTQLEIPDKFKNTHEDIEGALKIYSSFEDAIEEILSHEEDELTSRVLIGVKRSFNDWKNLSSTDIPNFDVAGRTVEFTNALELAKLAVDLFWLAELQNDRIVLINDFQTLAPPIINFDDDQENAFQNLKIEADSDLAQRVNIIRDFVLDKSVDLSFKLAKEALAEIFHEKTYSVFKQTISGYAIAHAIQTISIGYLIGDLLFGTGDVYHNFTIGLRTDELRKMFKEWRVFLRNVAKYKYTEPYDGQLAEKYRSAYLLEGFSTARMYRLYSDGFESSNRFGLHKINDSWIADLLRFAGADIEKNPEAAAEWLRELGVEIEKNTIEVLESPSFLDEAINLHNQRMALTPELYSLATFPPDEIEDVIDDPTSPVLPLTAETRATFEGNIYDDSGDRFSTSGGIWSSGSPGVEGNYKYLKNKTNGPGVVGKWLINPTARGFWEVLVYIPPGATTKSAQYNLYHNDQTETILIDQSKFQGFWVSLGIFEFQAQGEEYLTLSNITGEPEGSTKVTFDAIGIEFHTRGDTEIEVSEEDLNYIIDEALKCLNTIGFLAIILATTFYRRKEIGVLILIDAEDNND